MSKELSVLSRPGKLRVTPVYAVYYLLLKVRW